MKLSKKFLNEYIPIENISFKEIAEKMIFLGNEYEEYKKMCDATGLVVGKIMECEKHPESSKLSICKVDTGSSINQILCGAPNVEKGQKVIVAQVGSILPGNFEIKKAKLAGYDSEGMICSLAELGIEKKYLSEEDIEGIHVLGDDAKIGESALKYLGFDDEVIDFELTSNRGDLLSVLGMAYEIGAIYDLKVKEPDTTYQESNESIKDKYTLKVETEDCKLYLAALVKNVTISESPAFIKNRLIASGIRPINNVVDISNYVMLETGQPLHFFDADKISNIVVRNSINETITTLDNIERKVDKDIIVADSKTPIALAGVMGGLNSEVTESTKNIIIESAIFSPSLIRTTSRKTLRSEASARFEKGLPKERTYLAIKRAIKLLNEIAFGTPTKDMLIHDKLVETEKKIIIKKEKVNQILGMDLKIEDITEVFKKLDFKYEEKEEIILTIPSRRLDLNIQEDIIEEIGRIVGYNGLKGILPTSPIKRGKYSEKALYKKNIKNLLIGMGLNETLTYSLVSEEENNLFQNSNIEEIKLLDPISKDKNVMRKTLIPSLISVYNYNNARKIKNINIFEISSVYHKQEKYIENTKLSVLMSGIYQENKWQGKRQEVDFYLIKGILENLLSYLGFTNRIEYKVENLKDMHPGRSAQILLDRKTVGFIGQINPKISKNVYVLELDLDLLFDMKIKKIKYKEQSKYPSVTKDLAFVIEKTTKSKEIEDIIKRVGSRMLDTVEVFDLYEMVDKKSIAYSLTFKDDTKTLNDSEVMEVFNRIIKEVEAKTTAKLRSE